MNSIYLFQASLDCITACELDLSQLVAEEENEKIVNELLPLLKETAQINQIDVLMDVQSTHLKAAAVQLSATLLSLPKIGKPVERIS